MSADARFRIVQNKDDKTITLEFWRKYGEKNDDWLSSEKIEGITITELKELNDSLTKIFNKTIIKRV